MKTKWRNSRSRRNSRREWH